MALRALTPGKAAYCSECGADTPPEAEACGRCGAKFEGFMDAVLCPICNSINPAAAKECSKCQAKFPPEELGELRTSGGTASEEEYLRNILRLSREMAKARLLSAGTPPGGSSEGPASLTEADEEGSETEQALYKLAEPFDEMLARRKRRLEQMDVLIERARKRIAALGEATNPLEVREREELKRQIEELLLEKEDILKLEEGLVDLENTYRNILRMQQDELKARETSLRARVEAFRHELESREHAFGQIRERESDMVRREDEFRRLVNRLHEREKEFDKREELLREKARLLDERHHALSGAEVDLERRRWELEQKAGSKAPPTETTVTVQSSEEMNSLRGRLAELEEQMEKLIEEKSHLAEEQRSFIDLREQMKAVLQDLDELLGELPDEKIQRFAKSKGFARYEKILDTLEL